MASENADIYEPERVFGPLGPVTIRAFKRGDPRYNSVAAVSPGSANASGFSGGVSSGATAGFGPTVNSTNINIDTTSDDNDNDSELPDGSHWGDLLYWDPTATGDGGAWVVLDTSSCYEGSLLSFGEDAWSFIHPQDKPFGSIMYYDEDAWAFIEPPLGDGKFVLSIEGGVLSWMPTQDCET